MLQQIYFDKVKKFIGCKKILTHTIMAVSTGEADTSREPEGDQAMEVTGE